MPVTPEHYSIPNGMTAAPGLPFASAPTTGLRLDSDGNMVAVHQAVDVATIGANGLAGGIRVAEMTFTETAGAGTYTGTVALPAGSRILDIGVDGIALWNSAGACAIIVGDGVDPDGFFTTTDLKATDLLAGEINNFEHPGGKAGAFITAEQRQLYSAAARDVIAVVTIASGAGTLGRTRVYVVYCTPVPVAVAKV